MLKMITIKLGQQRRTAHLIFSLLFTCPGVCCFSRHLPFFRSCHPRARLSTLDRRLFFCWQCLPPLPTPSQHSLQGHIIRPCGPTSHWNIPFLKIGYSSGPLIFILKVSRQKCLQKRRGVRWKSFVTYYTRGEITFRHTTCHSGSMMFTSICPPILSENSLRVQYFLGIHPSSGFRV